MAQNYQTLLLRLNNDDLLEIYCIRNDSKVSIMNILRFRGGQIGKEEKYDELTSEEQSAVVGKIRGAFAS